MLHTIQSQWCLCGAAAMSIAGRFVQFQSQKSKRDKFLNSIPAKLWNEKHQSKSIGKSNNHNFMNDRKYSKAFVQVCCDNPQYAPAPTTEDPFDRTVPPGTFTNPPRVTLAPPTTTTMMTTTTRAPVTSAPLTNDQCSDPNGLVGRCISIRECPDILEQFVARQTDPAYTDYIRRSNAQCNYVQPYVCWRLIDWCATLYICIMYICCCLATSHFYWYINKSHLSCVLDMLSEQWR